MKLILPRLPGLNEYIGAERSNKHAAAGMKRQCERDIRLCIRAQWKGKVRFQRPVTIRYLWVEKNRRRDKDNIAFAKKFIQDSLVKEKVIQNDGWKEIDSWSDEFLVDAQYPRVEVEIEENEDIGSL